MLQHMGSGSVRGSCGALNSFLARHEEELQLLTESTSKNEHLLEYETLELRVNPPNVTVDNNCDEHATLLTVDSANRPGTLVEVVQYLTELDLVVKRARISSDGGWFVDEFHVTDKQGNKLSDPSKLEALRQICQTRDNGSMNTGLPVGELATVLEMSGADRPGLLSDVTALLARHGCNVVTAAVWTHVSRVALILMCQQGGQPIRDEVKLQRLRELLVGLLKDENNEGVAITGQSTINNAHQVRGRLHSERRLHQLLLNEDMPTGNPNLRQTSSGATLGGLHVGGVPMVIEEADGEEAGGEAPEGGGEGGEGEGGRPNQRDRPELDVRNCMHTGYTLLRITCMDRASLLFDTVCTLSDMQCDVYHATIDSANGMAFQEYYIRSRQGVMISSSYERELLKSNLLAAINRRTPEGLRVEVCCGDRPGLLADISRVLREAGLSVSRADVRTLADGRANEVFYVTDATGTEAADRAVVEAACRKIGGRLVDEVKARGPRGPGTSPGTSPGNSFSFSLLRNWSEVWHQ